MATCSVPDIDVDQSSGSQADRGGRWRLTDLGVRPLNVYDELTYEFTWCGQMGDRSRLGIIWIGCHKSFSSYRRSSENDSSLPLFFPTDERDCTKDFYSVNIKIYKMSASPQHATNQWLKMKIKKWSSQWTQFMQLRKEARKTSRTSTWFEPVTSRYQCDALPTELWSHWRCVHCDDHLFIFTFSFHFRSSYMIHFIIINKPMSGAGSPSCRPGSVQ